MIKKLEKADGQSMDIVESNIEQLKELFPEVFAEGKINFDRLQEVLGNYVVTDEDHYNFTWHGKRAAGRLAQTPSTGTLRPCPEESVDWDKTQNLFIEGDNLEVLKLLQKSYHQKIKMIYIDPPYNTGNDFVYEDDFKDGVKNYLAITGQLDGEGKKTGTNSSAAGRYHTNWLNMMYPRLKLARNLLRDDGVIFISIDDEEQTNLKKLCDEVFGEENYINTVSVNMKNIAGASGGGEDKRLKKNIEYLHIYAKNYYDFPSFENVYDKIKISDLVEKYKEEGKSWKYTTALVYDGDKEYLASTVDGDGNEIKIYARRNAIIKSINQIIKDESISEGEAYKKYAKRIFQTAMPQSSIRPRIMKKLLELKISEDFISIEYTPKSGKNKGNLYEQFYKGDSCRLLAWLGDVSEEIDGELYKKEMQGTYWDFANETKNLTKEGNVSFPNGKKPLALLKRLLNMQSEKDYIVLDFFAGSGSTAHAVIQQNIEDNGNRRFIMVQLPEKAELDPESDDSFKNIAELSKERIRRSAKKIKEENPLFSGDLGFKVFKLDTANIKTWEAGFDTLKDDLIAAADYIKQNRSSDDIVYELLLKYGLDLTVPIETRTIAGKKVYSIGLGALVVCLDNDVPMETVNGIGALKEELQPEIMRVVFKDSGFKDDIVKTNALQILKRFGIEDIKSL